MLTTHEDHTAECAADRDSLCWAVANECAVENWIDFTQCDPYELSAYDADLDATGQDRPLSSYALAMAEIDAWTADYIDSGIATCYREDVA